LIANEVNDALLPNVRQLDDVVLGVLYGHLRPNVRFTSSRVSVANKMYTWQATLMFHLLLCPHVYCSWNRHWVVINFDC